MPTWAQAMADPTVVRLAAVPMEVELAWPLVRLAAVPMEVELAWTLVRLAAVPMEGGLAWPLVRLAAVPMEVELAWPLVRLRKQLVPDRISRTMRRLARVVRRSARIPASYPFASTLIDPVSGRASWSMHRSRGSRIVISTETCRRRNRRWWRALGSRSGRAGAGIVGRRRSGGRPM